MPILSENTGKTIFTSDLQRASSSVKIGIFRITQNPPPAMACRFDSGYRHQSNIIRTGFSQWETGSDLLFLSTDTRKHTSETELRSSRPANRESTGRGRRIRKIRTEVRQDNKYFAWATGVLGGNLLSN